MKHPLAVEGLQEKFKNAMPGELEKFMKENAEAKGMQLLENLNAFVQVSETKRQRTLVQAGGEYLTEGDLMKMYSKKIVENMSFEGSETRVMQAENSASAFISLSNLQSSRAEESQ